MKINKIISLVALLVAGIQLSDAQQLPVYNTYFLNPFLYNPARAGAELDGGKLNLGVQKQWDRLTNGPISSFGSWDGRIKSSNMALGATIQHDRASNKWQTTTGSLAYAYHVPLTKDKAHTLSIGLQAGINSIGISQAFDATDQGDALALSGRSVAFDMSVGINYAWKGLNVGVSVPQILGNKAKFKTVDPTNASNVVYQRQIIFTTSYEAKLGKKKDWTFAPFVMVNFVDKSIPVYLDVTAMAKYKQLVWLAVGYNNGGGINGFISPNAAGIHATAGCNIKGLVDINYTYKAPVGSKGNLTFGNLGSTHEVLLSFRLKRKTDKSEFDENKKRTDDEIAKVNQKADDNAKKIDSVAGVVDSIGGVLSNVEKTANGAKSTSEKNSSDIRDINARLDNIVYKKFGSVYFEVDKSELTDEAKASIDAFKAKLATMRGNYFIYLAGSASTEGNTSYNQALSAKRCNAVKQYIEGVGIAQRVLLLPYGENAPVTDKQKVEDDRAKNRRVDIYLSGE